MLDLMLRRRLGLLLRRRLLESGFRTGVVVVQLGRHDCCIRNSLPLKRWLRLSHLVESLLHVLLLLPNLLLLLGVKVLLLLRHHEGRRLLLRVVALRLVLTLIRGLMLELRQTGHTARRTLH